MLFIGISVSFAEAHEDRSILVFVAADDALAFDAVVVVVVVGRQWVIRFTILNRFY